MLWPVALLNYLDRQMLSTIRSSVRADIPGIANDEDFGKLMAIFMWVYAFLSPVGGYLADKFNRRWTVIGSLFVWSAVTWLTGHAHSYGQMLSCRGLMGISEAFYIPAALALIADFHTGNTRAKAVGVHQTGIYAGLALGGIGGYIADHDSWRDCFTWFGAAGMIYAIILMIGLRDAKTSESREKNDSVSVAGTLRALWSQPAFWILVVYFTLPAISGWLTKNWLPTFLGDTFNLKQGPAGMSATGYIQLASLGGVFPGGVVSRLVDAPDESGADFPRARWECYCWCRHCWALALPGAWMRRSFLWFCSDWVGDSLTATICRSFARSRGLNIGPPGMGS